MAVVGFYVTSSKAQGTLGKTTEEKNDPDKGEECHGVLLSWPGMLYACELLTSVLI